MTVAYRDHTLTDGEILFRRNAFSNTLVTGCVQCIRRISGLAVAYRLFWGVGLLIEAAVRRGPSYLARCTDK